jgi:hypothetical protein
MRERTSSLTLPGRNTLLWLFNESTQTTPLVIEPWGAQLFLLPETRYLLATDASPDSLPTEMIDDLGRRTTFEREDEAFIKNPVRMWPAAGDIIRLFRMEGPWLVWDNESPSQVLQEFENPLTLEAIRYILSTESSIRASAKDWTVFLLMRPRKAAVRYDLPLFLQEHGLLEEHDGGVYLTRAGQRLLSLQ